MRTLLCLLSITIFFSSCQLHEAAIITTNPQPFVLLADGTLIHTHKVEWNYQKFQKEFVVNSTVYPSSMVSFYSDGVHSFANVHKKNYAEMISEGKINVYKTQRFHSIAQKKSGYGAGPFMRHNSIFDQYYIQNMQRDHNRFLVKLNYKNLENIMPGDAVAYDYIIQYRHQRKASTITACIGAAAIIGGAVLMTTKINKTSYSGAGLGLAGAGLATTAISIAVKIPYRVKLFKIIKYYN